MLNKNRFLLFLFLLIGPYIATAAGVFAVYRYDMPINVFFPNFVALATGIVLTLAFISKWTEMKMRQVHILSFLSLIVLASTFLFSGEINVHRWIEVGRLHINAAMVLLPVLLFCMNYYLRHSKEVFAVIIFLLVSTILVNQPDAGEATAFVLASILLFGISKINHLGFLGIFFSAVIVIFLSWQRVDLLEPVEYVEEILYMLAGLGLRGYLAIIISGIFIFSPFIYFYKKGDKELAAVFIVYLLSSFGVTQFGHYPVPLIGAGASSIIGQYLMLIFCGQKIFVNIEYGNNLNSERKNVDQKL